MDAVVYDGDVFDDVGILDPWPHYAAMRDLGSVVMLARQEMLAVTRYDDVRAVLADHETFKSGDGVLFSDIANELTRGTTLASDPPEHDLLRRVVAHQLTPAPSAVRSSTSKRWRERCLTPHWSSSSRRDRWMAS